MLKNLHCKIKYTLEELLSPGWPALQPRNSSSSSCSCWMMNITFPEIVELTARSYLRAKWHHWLLVHMCPWSHRIILPKNICCDLALALENKNAQIFSSFKKQTQYSNLFLRENKSLDFTKLFPHPNRDFWSNNKLWCYSLHASRAHLTSTEIKSWEWVSSPPAHCFSEWMFVPKYHKLF